MPTIKRCNKCGASAESVKHNIFDDEPIDAEEVGDEIIDRNEYVFLRERMPWDNVGYMPDRGFSFLQTGYIRDGQLLDEEG